MTNDESMTDDEARNASWTPVVPFVIRALAFLRHSPFVFRHSSYA
jgi:hypothetical protein